MSERSRQQSALSADVEKLKTWALSHEDAAAGVWLDNGADAGGPVRIGVGIVGDVAEAEARLRALVAHPESLDVVGKDHTEAALRALQQQVSADYLGRAADIGSSVTLVGLNLRTNKVRIGITPFDDVFAAELLDRYGAELIEVEHSSPVSHGPAVAGHRIGYLNETPEG